MAGEELHRIWRCAEPLTPSGTVDRVRWQLDAWLGRGRVRAQWTRLRLVPEETVTAGALQLGLWGDVGEADERAGRALVRVQALLGPEAVVTAVLVGGRDPAERVRLVPWGEDRRVVDFHPAAPPPPTPRPPPSDRAATVTGARRNGADKARSPARAARIRPTVGAAGVLARADARTVAGHRASGATARGPAQRRRAAHDPRRPGPAPHPPHKLAVDGGRLRRCAAGRPWPVEAG